jgi:hypothetical protein
MVVDEENRQPAVAVVVPGQENNRAIQVLFPEHVTVRRTGATEAEHLYMFQPGNRGDSPAWREGRNTVLYEKDLPGSIHMLARATLESDGILFGYEFANRSDIAYDMVYAVTDPRMTSMFHDVRLERTYVHHADGFDLLAAETPNRLSMPLNQWLPNRHLASYTWPIPEKHVEKRDDGITYYNKSRAVDEPLVATLSTRGDWIVASFSRTTGNVWSNPDLTCQHVDPQAILPPGRRAVLEVKMLIIRGSLQDVFEKVKDQRATLHAGD